MKHKRSEPSHNKTKESRTGGYFCQHRSLNSREGQVGIPGSLACPGDLGLPSSLATSCVSLPITARAALSPRGGQAAPARSTALSAKPPSTPLPTPASRVCQVWPSAHDLDALLPACQDSLRVGSRSPGAVGGQPYGSSHPMHSKHITGTSIGQSSNQQPRDKHPPNTGFTGKPHSYHSRCCQAINITQ